MAADEPDKIFHVKSYVTGSPLVLAFSPARVLRGSLLFIRFMSAIAWLLCALSDLQAH